MSAVSVIIPVYNVAPFIERCARSLFEQTFQDVEYIFVDDATPDNSMEILQEILREYPDKNVSIITHSENKGLAATRKTGINNAKGDYILMCDSDDYIEKETIQLLYEKALKENADIVVCDVYDEYDNYRALRTDLVVDNRAENFRNMLVNKKTQGYLVNKLIRKHLFDNTEITVPQGMDYLEDWFVTLRLYYFANTIIKVNVPLYHYVKYNTNAITKNIGEKHFKNTITFYKTLREFLMAHLLFDEYYQQISILEMQAKTRLLWSVRDMTLRHKYSSIFTESENLLWKKLKLSDKIMLCFSRHKTTLWMTSILRFIVILKQSRV
ncbi:MAG: glycosyltransferase [Bacteroidales bacterium]|jgi:glycosyltransferase involved in cell wall biosynthesis|nr:glycosyltransferase [Bacteroidales bacterium]